jgi:hypothetical protein
MSNLGGIMYRYLSQEDKEKILASKISYMEANLYNLSISKMESESRNDNKGLVEIEKEIETCLVFLNTLNELLDNI